MGNAAGGVWLSQLLYWDSVKVMTAEKKGEQFDGWFAKPDRELIEEAGLSRRECQEAKKRARELGVIDYKLIGMPRETNYKIDFDCLEDLLANSAAVQPVAHHRATSAHNAVQQADTNPLVELPPDESLDESLDGEGAKSAPHPDKEKTEPKRVDPPNVQRAKTRVREILAAQGVGERAEVADPKAESKAFVKEYAPVLGEIVGHAEPSDTDRAAARKLFGKRYPVDWLKEHMAHYTNGGGAEFRKPDANAYWILNRLSDDWAGRARSPAGAVNTGKALA